MKTIIVVIIVVAAGAGIYWYTKDKGQSPVVTPVQTSSNEAVSNDQGAQAPVQVETGAQVQVQIPAPTASVKIANFAYSPSALSVKAGTKVTWTNNDSVAHTVTADSGNALSSGTIAPGESFSFTFTSPGTISYHCAFHPMMKATITVN